MRIQLLICLAAAGLVLSGSAVVTADRAAAQDTPAAVVLRAASTAEAQTSGEDPPAPPAETPAPPAAEEDAPAAETEPTAEDLFAKGRDALFRGEYTQAIELLGKAVAADQTKTSYRLHLARAYRYAGNDPEAEKHLEKILQTAPDHVEAGQALAEICAAAKRFQDVVRVLEPLLKYRHDYPTYHMLAEAQYNLGKLDQARKYYEEAIKLNPQSASDHYQLGNIYLAGNFFALAADSYQAALRLGLDSPVLHYKLGSAYFNLRNYFGRIAEQAVKSGEPGTIHQRWYLIEPVPGRKDVFRCAPETSAVYQIAKAMADGIEDRPDIHVLRATVYLNARRYAQAYEMFTETAPTVPDEDKALFHYYYAQAAFGTGQYDRYLQLLQEAIKLDPQAYQAGLVDAYLRVADQHNEAGNLDKYVEYLVRAVAESSQTTSLHLKLGYAYEEARKHEQAMAQWQMVLDLEPDHPQRIELLNLIEKYRAGVALSVRPSETPKPDTAKPEPPPPATQ
ncbi:MAG: tetratricopeptide repeat protein [Pirellulales bacterium]|nr:tetratricopeptide repeat protein [Pirellulales bacterium]